MEDLFGTRMIGNTSHSLDTDMSKMLRYAFLHETLGPTGYAIGSAAMAHMALQALGRRWWTGPHGGLSPDAAITHPVYVTRGLLPLDTSTPWVRCDGIPVPKIRRSIACLGWRRSATCQHWKLALPVCRRFIIVKRLAGIFFHE